MDKLSPNIDITDDMEVIFRDTKCTLGEAIKLCDTGESIEGIHPFQYSKLLKRFEIERNKKFQWSSDTRYGNWRFILFDVSKPNLNGVRYENPLYITQNWNTMVTPIPLPSL